jgi:8-oxo-dGTP pyrophosphatase MutT (NUDIX family)
VIHVADFAGALAGHTPRLSAPTDKIPAAVAAVLRPGTQAAELLFIQRTCHPRDPWSGHIAFPGGRLEPADPDLYHAAVRETDEEVGLDLEQAQHLGRLCDLTGASLPVCVAGFAFQVSRQAVLSPNEEVQEAFWVPVDRLLESERQIVRTFAFEGLEDRAFPAIDILGPGRPVLWGLTYRFTAQLMELAGHPLPAPDVAM